MPQEIKGQLKKLYQNLSHMYKISDNIFDPCLHRVDGRLLLLDPLWKKNIGKCQRRC